MGIFVGGVLASLVIMGRTVWRSLVVGEPRTREVVRVGVVGGLIAFFGGWYVWVLLWTGF